MHYMTISYTLLNTIQKMQEFIIGLEADEVDWCWWGEPDKVCDVHEWEEGKVLARCGACGKQTTEWDPYTIFDYCGKRPFINCQQCNGTFILCVNTGHDDLGKLHQDSCCRVLTEADQHEIPNFEQLAFRDGKPISMMFIACRALAITHVDPIQFEEVHTLVPKSADELAAKAALDEAQLVELMSDYDSQCYEQLVELRTPVFDYGGQCYELHYRGVCPCCHREVVSSVSAD